MQNNLLWTGREYFSLENCLVEETSSGLDATATIIGLYTEKIYRIEYRIRTNENGETVYVEIHSRHSNKKQYIRLEGNGKGNWMYNGEKAEQFDGCVDVDIPLTPFTNTLPVKRLRLKPNQSTEIQVLYVNLLDEQIKTVRQKYTCLSETEYHYENVPNDFEATIQLDKQGFVTDYPSLFFRKAALRSNYTNNSS